MNREEALAKLLTPIEWTLSSSIGYRKQLVRESREAVHLVYPFLTPYEKILADQWLRNNEHSGLWD